MNQQELTSYFDDCFGIINPTDKKPENIILSFSKMQGKYIKTFPLHEPFTVLKDDENEYRIKFKIHITYDFVMELLSYGWDLKVISPKKLIDEIKDILSGALEHYKE